jgi:hypothetical protein
LMALGGLFSTVMFVRMYGPSQWSKTGRGAPPSWLHTSGTVFDVVGFVFLAGMAAGVTLLCLVLAAKA